MKACTTAGGLHAQYHKQQHKLLVSTPYGEGVVLRTRNDGTQEIELTSWGQKAGKEKTKTTRTSNPTMLYSKTVFPPISPTTIGTEVVCLYGRGKLIDIRTDDDVFVVQLSSWRLANRSRVTCYLQKECVRCVRPKELYEMNVYERVEYALERKKIAAHEFAAKQYPAALQIYTQAVEAVRNVQHTSESSNNAIRADLLVVMITCSNNAATCCLKLERWNDAYQHATASLLLLEALEPKKGGKIHQELLAQGHSDVQVFGEWKVKSFLVSARALAEKGQVEKAMEIVRQARKVIASYTTTKNNNNTSDKLSVKRLHTNDKELLTLLTNLKKRRKAQLAKEKQYAQAMFRPSSSKPTRAESPPSSGTCSTTTIMKPSSPRSAATNDVSSAPSSSTKERDMNGETEVHVAKKKVSFADLDDSRSNKKKTIMDKEIPWHKDAALLGGLGVMVGSFGAVLLLSQFLRRK